MRILKRFLRKFFHYDWGRFELKHGKHSIHVPATICVSEIWINYTECGRDGCGQEQHSWVRCEPRGRGIDFYAEINTETCTIEWFAT